MAVTFAASARAQVHAHDLPPLTESATSNGLTVIAARKEPIPLVAITLAIPAGSSLDPAGKHGLADFTAQLLRRGTAKLTADQINEAVEFVGGSLGIGVSSDLLQLSITAPARHLPEMLDVLGQLVSEPTFPQAEVDAARERTLAHLANELDDPGSLADRALEKALWGNHPYGHVTIGSAKHVKTFTRDDVVRFHKERIGPKVALLVVVGAVDPSQVAAAAEKAFGRWQGGPQTPPALPPFEKPAMAGHVLLVDKPEQSQSQVRIAGVGHPSGHPDHIPTTVLNTVLGGGFTSRLVDEIRVNRGLSYGVSSYFDRLKVAGAFGVSTFTKNETTGEIIEVALREVKKLREKGATPKELAKAKKYVAGLYPLRTESNEAIAGAIIGSRMLGLGHDWVQTYRARINAVTPKQVAEVAKRYFLVDAPTIVVVGNAAQVRPQLEKFGKVKVVPAAELE